MCIIMMRSTGNLSVLFNSSILSIATYVCYLFCSIYRCTVTSMDILRKRMCSCMVVEAKTALK